ncbi:MAG TPA: SDR family oxidoreductase [Bryobacteraceae bacterium]|nr:SDR family oxidoreductase [Bryobacteraceae bacterium]
MNCLVIGGTQFIGRLMVAELLQGGHAVTVLHRKPKHDLGRRVKNIAADRNDGAAMKSALAGKKFDAVFDNVYDWQRGTTAGHVESTVKALGNNLHRYVFMSSVAAYGDGLNHHEGDALAPDDAPDLYVRNKAMSERALFRLHQRTGLPVVTLRPPYIYGPGNPFYREAYFWDRLRAGRPIVLPGDGRRLMQFVYVKDLVRAALKAMDEPNAAGHAFNIANARPLSQIEVVEAIAQASKKPVNFVRVPREYILRAGGHAMGPKLYFGFYMDNLPITQVTAKAQRVLKFKPTEFVAGLKETYKWYLRHNTFAKQNYEFEDKLIAGAPAVIPAKA